MMRKTISLTFLILLVSGGLAHAQSWAVHGSAGPTLRDPGYSVAAGVKLTANRFAALVVNIERTHLANYVRHYGDVVSTFRGVTLTLATAELRVTPFGNHRWGPFGLIGTGTGVARPNEDARFPGEGTTGRVRSVFVGGGLQLPVRERLSVFTEFRMMLVGEEQGEGLVGAGPLRAGVAWRF